MKSYYNEILELKEEIRRQTCTPDFDIQAVEFLLEEFDTLCAFEREIMMHKNDICQHDDIKVIIPIEEEIYTT